MDVRACKTVLVWSAVKFAFAGQHNTHHRSHSTPLSAEPLSVRISCIEISYCAKIRKTKDGQCVRYWNIVQPKVAFAMKPKGLHAFFADIVGGDGIAIRSYLKKVWLSRAKVDRSSCLALAGFA